MMSKIALVLLLAVIGGSDARWYLMTSHPHVVLDVTTDPALTCKYTSGYYDFSQISRIRILKNDAGRHWELVAEVRDTSPDAPTSNTGLKVRGHVGSEWNSFLEISWPTAEMNTLGRYKCEVMGFDSDSIAVIRDTPIQLMVEDTVNATQVLHLLLREQAELQHEITEQRDNCTNTVNQLESAIDDLENRVLRMEASQRSRTWPKGLYGLLSPNTGCPNNGIDSWRTGQLKMHTESSNSTNLNSVSTPNNFAQPIFESSNSDLFMNQHFCVKENVGIFSDWPRGTYCINKRDSGSCPNGFSSGYIRFDDEDSDRATQTSGNVPEIVADSSYYRISYCCRSDSAPGFAISLPTENPFYLYRYKGTCQSVSGMTVSQQFMYFDTEDNSNGDRYENLIHPDGKANNDVRIELCYYR